MASVIVLDDGGDPDWLDEPFRYRCSRSCSVSSTEILAELEAEDWRDDVFFTGEIIDLTDDEPNNSYDHLHTGEALLDYIRAGNSLLVKRGDFLEVNHIKLGDHPIDFIKAQVLIRDRNGEPQIRGTAYTRTKNFKGRLKKNTNEVCMIRSLENRENGLEDREILFDVSPFRVVKKRTLVITNARYPAHAVNVQRYHIEGRSSKFAQRQARRRGELVCRWELFLYYTVLDGRRKPDEEAIQHLREESVPEEKFRVSDAAVKQQYGNGIQHLPTRKYTVFDSFCGAGGVSRGAQSAGFQIKYAIDKSPEV